MQICTKKKKKEIVFLFSWKIICHPCAWNAFIRDMEANPSGTVWPGFPAPCVTPMSLKSYRGRKQSRWFSDSALAPKAQSLLTVGKFEWKQAFPS